MSSPTNNKDIFDGSGPNNKLNMENDDQVIPKEIFEEVFQEIYEENSAFEAKTFINGSPGFKNKDKVVIPETNIFNEELNNLSEGENILIETEKNCEPISDLVDEPHIEANFFQNENLDSLINKNKPEALQNEFGTPHTNSQVKIKKEEQKVQMLNPERNSAEHPINAESETGEIAEGVENRPEPVNFRFTEFEPIYEAQVMNRTTIHLLNSIGVSIARQSVIDLLTNLTTSYLTDLAFRCKRIAEHSNRTRPNLPDIEAVFEEIGISADDLEAEAISRMDARPVIVPKAPQGIHPDSPFFPLPALSQSPQESTVKLPKNLPNFPSQHTYMETPEKPKRNTDPDYVRQCNAKQTRQVEENLNRLLLQQPKPPKRQRTKPPTLPDLFHPQFSNGHSYQDEQPLQGESTQLDLTKRRSSMDFEDELFEEIQESPSQETYEIISGRPVTYTQSLDRFNGAHLEPPTNGTSLHLVEEDSSDGERPFANYADTKFYHLERGSSLKNSAELNNTNGNSNLN